MCPIRGKEAVISWSDRDPETTLPDGPAIHEGRPYIPHPGSTHGRHGGYAAKPANELCSILICLQSHRRRYQAKALDLGANMAYCSVEEQAEQATLALSIAVLNRG
jgi:hypothetical protein